MLTERFLEGLGTAVLALLLLACGDAEGVRVVGPDATAPHFDHNSAADAEKGHIGGWLDGETVRLHYTKLYFCAEPPESGASSDCVVGAPAEVEPRPGPIPLLYAIAAPGIRPDPATLHCQPAAPCLNHPTTLDVSRIGGPASVLALPHSHIVTSRRGGWHQTVNIRVFDLNVWNQIVAAKSLAKVRELQADPSVGGAGLISQDTPTNIYFFLQVHPGHREP